MKPLIQMNDNELAKALADDLVEMHVGTYIDLRSWPAALELVSRYHSVMLLIAKEN